MKLGNPFAQQKQTASASEDLPAPPVLTRVVRESQLDYAAEPTTTTGKPSGVVSDSPAQAGSVPARLEPVEPVPVDSPPAGTALANSRPTSAPTPGSLTSNATSAGTEAPAPLRPDLLMTPYLLNSDMAVSFADPHLPDEPLINSAGTLAGNTVGSVMESS